MNVYDCLLSCCCPLENPCAVRYRWHVVAAAQILIKCREFRHVSLAEMSELLKDEDWQRLNEDSHDHKIYHALDKHYGRIADRRGLACDLCDRISDRSAYFSRGPRKTACNYLDEEIDRRAALVGSASALDFFYCFYCNEDAERTATDLTRQIEAHKDRCLRRARRLERETLGLQNLITAMKGTLKCATPQTS